MAREIPEQTFEDLDFDAVLLPRSVGDVIANAAGKENFIGAIGLVATVTIEGMRDADGNPDLSQLEPEQVAGTLLVTGSDEDGHTIVGQLYSEHAEYDDGVKARNSLRQPAEKVERLLGGVAGRLMKLAPVKEAVKETVDELKPESPVTPLKPVPVLKAKVEPVKAVVPGQRLPAMLRDPVLVQSYSYDPFAARNGSYDPVRYPRKMAM